MSFTHFINGVAISEPIGWKEFAQEISRDRVMRIIALKYPSTASFTQSAYTTLRDLFLVNDCDIVRYEAFETCGAFTTLLIRADIILADCKWNLARCTVECSLVDDGIGSRITNNLKVPISPGAPKTKNGEVLTPVAPIALSLFTPSTGIYLATPRAVLDWLEAMQHAVRYITDSNVALVSQWYSTLPTDERIAITTGFQIRTAANGLGDDRVVYNFEDLFGEMALKYNLWMAVQRDLSGNPFVVVEPEEAFYTPGVAASFPWTDNLIQSVDREQLWATVRVGSEDGIKNMDAVLSLPYLVLQGFSEELFPFEGICNTDSELNLVSKWGIDTNLIEKVLGGDTGFEEKTFLIQYDSTTNDAVQADWYNPGGVPVLYNEQLLNINVLNRYDLPSNIGSFYNALDASFEAQRLVAGATVTDSGTAASTGTFSVAPFPSIISDPGGNYTPNDYTAPSQGYYVFNVVRQWRVTANSFPVVLGNVQKRAISRIRLERYNLLNVLVGFVEFSSSQPIALPGLFTPPGTYTHNITQGFILNVGDYVRALFRFDFTSSFDPLATGSITAQDLPLSTFGTTFVATGGGVITSVDPGAARVITYEFDRIANAAQWESMTADPTQVVRVSHDADLRDGHIINASRNIYKGTTSYTLIAKRSDR
jgi:hypothetical protein